jgi:hypothetical protein
MELGAASHAPSHAPFHEAAVRELLARGPLSSKALQQRLALSQPTVSRAGRAGGSRR